MASKLYKHVEMCERIIFRHIYNYNVKLRSYVHSNMRGSMLFIRMFDRVNGVIAPNMRDQHAEPFSV